MNIKPDITRIATVIGATGLIGNHLLNVVQKDDFYQKVKAIVRRPVNFDLSKVETVVIDFSNSEEFKQALEGSHAIFCAVGTTNKKVKGDKSKYRKVDYDILVNAARICQETGCPNFLAVSAVGANSQSGNFYLKLKGETEDTIGRMKINSISFFRPSMLLGDRKESRFGESLGKMVMQPFSFLIPSKYKPVHAREVASAMLSVSKKESPGVHVYHYREMKKSG